MKNKLLLVFSGLLSGIISYQTYVSISDSFSPGIVFGLILAIYSYFLIPQKNLAKLLLFVVVSTIAYVSTIYLSLGIGSVSFLSGALGVAIMLFGFSFLIKKISFQKYILLVILGGLLSYSVFLPFWHHYEINSILTKIPFYDWKPVYKEYHNYNMEALFAIWQMGICAGLAFFPQRFIKKK